MHQQTVAVVGLGYVGLPLALLADSKGYRVTGIDTDKAKIQDLLTGATPSPDTTTPGQIRRAHITYTTDFELIREADIVIFCVPTPVTEQHQPNLEPVKSAAWHVGELLHSGQLVVLESTVNPGVCESVLRPILESQSGLVAGRDFYLAHCPERINPGDPEWNVANIPRVVGSLEPRGLELTVRFYRSIIDADVRPMGSIKEAEAVKVVENSFRDINIAFVNELAMSFDKLGINVLNVINGAASKPFAFMPHFPGCGVGGHCIPVDPYYLIEYARENGFNHRLLSLARSINKGMPRYTAQLAGDLLAETGMPIDGAKVTVLGLAYKADIADTRESPTIAIVEALEGLGAQVEVFDPYVPSTFPVELAALGGTGYRNHTHKTALDSQALSMAVRGAQAVVVATGHRQFVGADPVIFADAGVRAIIDGRNCLDRERIESLGILYKGIGY